MASTSVRPTGERREFTPQQIFFSTTDRRGVIGTVNSTFVGSVAIQREMNWSGRRTT